MGSASIQMLAHLLLLLGVCSVASLRVVGTSTQIGAVGPLVGPACLRFSDKHADATDSTFEEPRCASSPRQQFRHFRAHARLHMDASINTDGNLGSYFGRCSLCSGKADWFVCSGPSDDPELSCFLAPDWMDIEKVDGKDNWVCVRGANDTLSFAPANLILTAFIAHSSQCLSASDVNIQMPCTQVCTTSTRERTRRSSARTATKCVAGAYVLSWQHYF